jgi:hypothetical protein
MKDDRDRPSPMYTNGMKKALFGILPVVAMFAAMSTLAGPAQADIASTGALAYKTSITPSGTGYRQYYHVEGGLKIRINAQGIVNGVYRGDRLGKGPVVGDYVQVTGGRTGSNIHLTFGSGFGFSATGTIEPDGQIVGSGYDSSGQLFDFTATLDTTAN